MEKKRMSLDSQEAAYLLSIVRNALYSNTIRLRKSDFTHQQPLQCSRRLTRWVPLFPQYNNEKKNNKMI